MLVKPLAFSLVLALPATAVAQNAFTGIGAIEAGPPPFGSSVSAVADDAAAAAGTSAVDAFGSVGAVRWGAGMLDPLGVGGSGSSAALGATPDLGVIVGARNVSFLPAPFSQAYRWTGGVTTDLGDFAGGETFSQALDVSDDGLVVVGFGSDAAGEKAFRWAGLGIVALGSLPGGSGVGRATAVSADGSVITGTEVVSGHNEAFRWQGGNMTPVGDLPGGSVFSEGRGISDDGSTIVGRSSSANGTEAYRARSGSLLALGDLPGGLYFSSAEDANEDGSVVVGSADTGGQNEAFIWTQQRGMRNLRTVMVNEYGLGAALAGWTLTGVSDISADGRVLAGSGIDPDGFSQGWIATLDARMLPVPSLGPDAFALVVALLAASGGRLAGKRCS